jgi:uncharacterized protein (DUF2236 family)
MPELFFQGWSARIPVTPSILTPARLRDDDIAMTDDNLELQLRFVHMHAAGSLAGVLGPDSVTWRINREAALILGAGRALLLQLAHPWVATAVAEHSQVFADPIGRFHRTFRVMFTMIFGTLDQALNGARRLHRRHAAITGVMPTAAGPFVAGSQYRANETSAQCWVHATLVETAIVVYDLIFAPLSSEERERYYAESCILAALFGIPRASLPPSWEDFATYNKAMWQSETLTVIPEARAIAEQVLRGTKVWLLAPKWYGAVTAGMLPHQLRKAFRLPYGEAEQRIAEAAIARIRRVYPALPERLRYVGPYQEAVARLSGSTRPIGKSTLDRAGKH